MTTIDKFFPPDDLKRIEAAVGEAERQTSGEIVPYVVQQSDPYNDALWRGGAVFAAVALAIVVLIHNFSRSWVSFTVFEIGLAAMCGAFAGALLARFVEPLRRFFAGEDLMDRRARQRAAEAFLSEEVFNTRDRTGILIFLSLLEHEVVILGDSGINAKVRQEEWEKIARTIADGMKAGTPTDSLIEAIRQCGELLKRKSVAPRPDDKDELNNAMRRGDR